MNETISHVERFFQEKVEGDFDGLFRLNEKMRQSNLEEACQVLCNEIYRFGLVVEFSWYDWHKGIEWIKQPGSDVSGLSLVELCLLLTTIIRADRFNEGLFSSAVASGRIYNIISSMKEHLKNNDWRMSQ